MTDPLVIDVKGKPRDEDYILQTHQHCLSPTYKEIDLFYDEWTNSTVWDTPFTLNKQYLFQCNLTGCSSRDKLECYRNEHELIHERGSKINCVLNDHTYYRKKVTLDKNQFKCVLIGCFSKSQEQCSNHRHKLIKKRARDTIQIKNYNCKKRYEYSRLISSSYLCPKLYKCPWKGCAVKLESKYNRQKHYATHLPARVYQCQYYNCRMYFKLPQTLKQHVRMHTDVSYGCQLYKCNCSVFNSSLKKKEKKKKLKHTPTEDRANKINCNWMGCKNLFTKEKNSDGSKYGNKLRLMDCTWCGCNARLENMESMLSHIIDHLNAVQ